MEENKKSGIQQVSDKQESKTVCEFDKAYEELFEPRKSTRSSFTQVKTVSLIAVSTLLFLLVALLGYFLT